MRDVVRRISENRHVRVVVQRVRRAAVRVDGAVVATCGAGLLALLGIAEEDTEVDADRMAARVSQLRIFENDAGKLDLAVGDIGGEVLVVSQFTLIADTNRGNRPSFAGAARPEQAEPLYERFCAAMRDDGLRVATGVFGARMEVELVNDGPVTIVVD
jgi:D-tyrosyl-tRNA(Tyr) deacylase